MLPRLQFLNGWVVKNVIKTRRELWRRHLKSANQNGEETLYIVHMNYLLGGATKMRKHWEFGTLFYEGPEVWKLLDLTH